MLETLKDKFNQIKQNDKDFFLFGSETHKYQSTPSTPEAIQKLEEHFNCQLPEEYKKFLLQIGSGMGPNHRLYSPEEIIKNGAMGWEEHGDETPEDFDFTQDDWHVENFKSLTLKDLERINNTLNQNPEIELYNASPYVKFLEGALIISENGCEFYNVLIIAGELKGTVWSVEIMQMGWPSGIYRYNPSNTTLNKTGTTGNSGNSIRHNTPFHFIQWVDDWANEYLVASKQIKN